VCTPESKCNAYAMGGGCANDASQELRAQALYPLHHLGGARAWMPQRVDGEMAVNALMFPDGACMHDFVAIARPPWRRMTLRAPRETASRHAGRWHGVCLT